MLHRNTLTATLLAAALVPTLVACTLPSDQDAAAPSADSSATSVPAPSHQAQPPAMEPSPAESPEKQDLVSEERQVGDLEEAVAAVVQRFGGSAGVALSDGRQAGDLLEAPAWSTSKVPLAMAAERAGVADPSLVNAAIQNSDNEAAAQLWQALGGGQQAATAVENEIATLVGSSPTVPAQAPRPEFSAFGQTQWSLADQAHFAAALPGSDVAGPVLQAMYSISPSQSFGLGQLPGSAFKGGWGPELDGRYTVRQLGVVGGVGVAIMVRTGDGTFESGQAALNLLASQLGLA